MEQILLGFMTAAYLALLGAGYLFVYKPWVIMRRDMSAMAAELRDVKAKLAEELQLRKVINRTDSDLARIEAQGSLRRLLREGESYV